MGKRIKDADNVGRKLIIDANRRLQETTQQLFMAKRELEIKNKELIDREKERLEKEKLEQFEHDAMKRLAGPEKKITRNIAEDLELRYITLLKSYFKYKNLDKDNYLVEELWEKFIWYGITPKGIISMHLKAVPQIKTIGDLETRRIIFESRIVLLKIMTQYASLLREKHEKGTN